MEGQSEQNKSTDSGKSSKSSNISTRSKNCEENQSKQNVNPIHGITTQPTVVQFPQSLQAMDGQHTQLICAPGLEYLMVVDQLIIKQKIEVFEVLTGCEMRNRYSVQNILGQNVFQVKEVSNCCDRICCNSLRPLQMVFHDYYEREVFYFDRPLRCDSCICFCCLQEIRVEAPRGNIIGYVIQDFSILYPKLHIENSLRQTIFRIEGPLCPCSCCCNDVDFDILSVNQSIKVGKISKLWSGCIRETYTDSDFFRVAFPMDLDVNMKAMLLSAAFLIDYIYFEI